VNGAERFADAIAFIPSASAAQFSKPQFEYCALRFLLQWLQRERESPFAAVRRKRGQGHRDIAASDLRLPSMDKRVVCRN